MTPERIAALLVDARIRHRQLALADLGDGPATADDAYRVHDAVAAALGWFREHPPRAWKVGASATGATPIAVPLPPSGVVASPASFAGGTFHGIGIEAEIAFRFRDSVVADATTAAAFDWRRVVGELVVTIEVVDSRIREGTNAPALIRLADAQLHGALVVGDAIPWQPLDWRSLHATVRRNGDVVADTRGGHPLGDPTTLLPWFVHHVAQRSAGVRAGDLATAGTWVGIVAAQRGDTIDVEFAGVGRARARFA